jgi:hypothetical protein
MPHLTREAVVKAMTPTPWDISNRVLYDLCARYPAHTSAGEVLAKILLIGRVYAAAIERRKTKTDDDQNDDFYVSNVAPAIQASPMDDWLDRARAAVRGTHEAFATLVETHSNVTGLFSDISGLKNRSLASKYLHFHVPDLFYIYDSRAVEAMRTFSSLLTRATRTQGTGDNEYRKFAEKCADLAAICESEFGLCPLPRHIDNLLLATHAGETKPISRRPPPPTPASARSAQMLGVTDQSSRYACAPKHEP